MLRYRWAALWPRTWPDVWPLVTACVGRSTRRPRSRVSLATTRSPLTCRALWTVSLKGRRRWRSSRTCSRKRWATLSRPAYTDRWPAELGHLWLGYRQHGERPSAQPVGLLLDCDRRVCGRALHSPLLSRLQVRPPTRKCASYISYPFRLHDWSVREAYLELNRRERLGLPLIDKNLVPPDQLELPTDEELGDTEVYVWPLY